MGRLCAVPHCYTGYKRKSKEKVSLYKVPDDDFFLTKWQEAIAREDRPITPKDYVCEKHFTKDDIIRKRIRKDVVEEYQRPKLKPDAVPSIFPELPEFILKMTKKRRKMTEGTLPTCISTTNLLDNGSVTANNNTEVRGGEDSVSNIKTEPQSSEDGNEVETDLNTDEIEIKEEINYESLNEEEELEEFDSSGAKLHHCDMCNYRTKFAHNLRTHKVKHLFGEDAFMRCELCTTFKTKWEITYLNHMKTKHGVILKELFKCPFCSFKTKNKRFLLKHCEKDHNNQEGSSGSKYVCDTQGCDYQTESQALMNIHTLTHDKPESQDVNKTYACKECYFASNSKGCLSKHVTSVHNVTSEEPAKKMPKVNHENKKRTKDNRSNLKASRNIKKMSFTCNRCPYKSHSQSLLDYHLLKHQMTANKTPLLCKKCSFITYSQDDLDNHWKSAFHCDQCPYASENESDYAKHTLNHADTSVDNIQYNASSIKKEKQDEEEMPPVQNFCMVTIKEERQDLLDE